MKLVCKRFEELTVDELYRILECRAEIFIFEQNIVYHDLDYKDQRSYHLFIEEDGRLLSYLRVIDSGVKYPASSIGRVVTVKDRRKEGLAGKLIEKAIEIIRDRGEKIIKIEAQAYLKKYYESFGFKPTSVEYILEGLPHIDMIYEL